MTTQKELSPLLPIDELNILPEYDYAYTDKMIRQMDLKCIRRFENAKLIMIRMQESMLARKAAEMYDDMIVEMYAYLLDIAQHEYTACGGKGRLTYKWLKEYVTGTYDPVMKRVISHEADRKKGVYVESILSTDNRAAENDVRMREWIRFANQAALNATDIGAVYGFEKTGVRKVVWITRKDEKVCDECYPRHGKIFEIDNLPDKHPNCRCVLAPVRSRQ